MIFWVYCRYYYPQFKIVPPSVPRDFDFIPPKRYILLLQRTVLEPLWEGRELMNCSWQKTGRIPDCLLPTQIEMLEHKTDIPELFLVDGYWCISAEVKKIIETIDTFKHQFNPVKFVDMNGNIVDTKPFYILNIRRRLKPQIRGPYTRYDSSIDMYIHEVKSIVPLITETVGLKEKVEQSPLWQHAQMNVNTGFFINEALFHALQNSAPSALPAKYPDCLEPKDLMIFDISNIPLAKD